MENSTTPRKLNVILKIIMALGNVLGKLKLKCHSKCCESDCVMNEEQREIKRKKTLEGQPTI
tara:strand:+ start:217 stop:402 length:186 start_codon:yes stop_codon:yes gene_type:complete